MLMLLSLLGRATGWLTASAGRAGYTQRHFAAAHTGRQRKISKLLLAITLAATAIRPPVSSCNLNSGCRLDTMTGWPRPPTRRQYADLAQTTSKESGPRFGIEVNNAAVQPGLALPSERSTNWQVV